jgi:putative peptide maturation dehydrogenase
LFEPRERFEIDLEQLLSSTPRLASVLQWVALTPHQDREVAVDISDIALLGQVSPTEWAERATLLQEHPAERIDRLLGDGLLVSDEGDSIYDVADRAQRALHWRALSAVAHRHSRWHGIDTDQEAKRLLELSDGEVLDHFGTPPPPAIDCSAADQRIALPRTEASALERLLDRRVTCRNFDPARGLTLDEVGAVLWRVFGARTDVEITGVRVLKKGVPSAGGLHPTEAYLLVQRVDGLAPGLYHYHPLHHALEPLRELSPTGADEHNQRFVAAQAHFRSAPLLLVMASRFERNFWKYRNHAKAYRATILDAGHLSQTLYLAATELGLAAFITAAVNEGDIEEAYGLDPMQQGVIAVSGFGHRATHRVEIEFDPLNAVWPAG